VIFAVPRSPARVGMAAADRRLLHLKAELVVTRLGSLGFGMFGWPLNPPRDVSRGFKEILHESS
jgi:hypothetical protein